MKSSSGKIPQQDLPSNETRMGKSLKTHRSLATSVVLMIVASLSYFSVASLPEDRVNPQQLTAVLLLLIATILLVGNILLGMGFNRFLPWKKYPVARFLIQLITSSILAVAAVSSAYFLIKRNLTEQPPDPSQLITANLVGLSVLLPAFSIYYGIRFIRSWRKSEIEAEMLQKESARSQMISLKNHLDPHFLFNNLNVLSSLMETDIEGSKVFLEHFSDVYRTLLRSESEDLVTLEEELQLIHSYTYLLKIRFGPGLVINMDVSAEDRQKYLPPLSLQMLIENVVKHNIASKSKPSIINISSKYNYLTVSNNIQPKPFNEKTKSGTGLDNLVARFRHFSGEPVHIRKEDAIFHVHLPLIQVE